MPGSHQLGRSRYPCPRIPCRGNSAISSSRTGQTDQFSRRTGQTDQGSSRTGQSQHRHRPSSQKKRSVHSPRIGASCKTSRTWRLRIGAIERAWGVGCGATPSTLLPRSVWCVIHYVLWCVMCLGLLRYVLSGVWSLAALLPTCRSGSRPRRGSIVISSHPAGQSDVVCHVSSQDAGHLGSFGTQPVCVVFVRYRTKL